jgi:hypothetical protein
MINSLSKFLVIFIIVVFSNNNIFSQFCFQDQSDLYWKISESLYGSRRLSDCSSGANYNCHGLAMYYVETTPSPSCPKPSWSYILSTPYACPNSYGNPASNIYQINARYVHVGSEVNGSIAYYQFTQGDHSAVKENIGGGVFKYLSKYNHNGPLVAHNLMQSWYHLTGQDIGIPVQFWSYVGYIQGSSTIIGTGLAQFSVINIPSVIYSWSVPSGYSNISIYSGSNQSTVYLAPSHSGSAILQLNISSDCDATIKTQLISLNITTNICLEGTYDNAGVYSQNLNTMNHVTVGGVAVRVSCPNATTFIWQKTGGNINGYFPNGTSISFNMTSGGSISFLVTAKNGSTTIGTRNIAFYN